MLKLVEYITRGLRLKFGVQGKRCVQWDESRKYGQMILDLQQENFGVNCSKHGTLESFGRDFHSADNRTPNDMHNWRKKKKRQT